MTARHAPSVCLGLFALALALLAPMAYGQDTTKSRSGVNLSPTDLTQDQIRATARVIVAMQRLQDRYMKTYGNPQNMDSTKAQEVRRKFREEQRTLLNETVSEEPITAEEYTHILQLTRRDSTLRRKMRAAVLKARKKQAQQENQDEH